VSRGLLESLTHLEMWPLKDTSTPEFLRTSGLLNLCCRSDDVELSTETVAWSTPQWPPPCLHAYWRHFFSRSTSVYSAL